MLTAGEVIERGRWDMTNACDVVTLDLDERHRRRFHYHGEGGVSFLLHLPRAIVLQDGDGLQLSDGRIVLVRAAEEALMEVRTASLADLLRLAWHIGNRHLPAEIRLDSIRLREDHVIRAMLIGLGATVVSVSAPFSPEQGAYAGGGHGHDHGGLDPHVEHHDHAAHHDHAGHHDHGP